MCDRVQSGAGLLTTFVVVQAWEWEVEIRMAYNGALEVEIRVAFDGVLEIEIRVAYGEVQPGEGV